MQKLTKLYTLIRIYFIILIGWYEMIMVTIGLWWSRSVAEWNHFGRPTSAELYSPPPNVRIRIQSLSTVFHFSFYKVGILKTNRHTGRYRNCLPARLFVNSREFSSVSTSFCTALHTRSFTRPLWFSLFINFPTFSFSISRIFPVIQLAIIYTRTS